MWALPLAATLINALYAIAILTVFYRKNREPAYIAWSLSLFALALSSLLLFLASTGGWTPFTSKAYYLIIAVSIMALLSNGTAYLLAPRAIAHVWLALVLLSILSAATLLARSGMNMDVLADTVEPGWKAIEVSEMLLGLASALNSIGTLVLVVGAVFAYVYKRMVKANITIAAGAIVLYYGSNMIKELGSYELIAVGQVLGASIVFAGIALLGSPGNAQPADTADI